MMRSAHVFGRDLRSPHGSRVEYNVAVPEAWVGFGLGERGLLGVDRWVSFAGVAVGDLDAVVAYDDGAD